MSLVQIVHSSRVFYAYVFMTVQVGSPEDENGGSGQSAGSLSESAHGRGSMGSTGSGSSQSSGRADSPFEAPDGVSTDQSRNTQGAQVLIFIRVT